MNVIVLFESMTGNTHEAADRIAAGLDGAGHTVTALCRPKDLDLQLLAEADLVVVGTWTDGIFVFGQRPAHGPRLGAIPYMVGKKAAVFCTYALNPGKTIPKLTAIVEQRGGTVVHGAALHRKKLPNATADFVVALLGALEKGSATA